MGRTHGSPTMIPMPRLTIVVWMMAMTIGSYHIEGGGLRWTMFEESFTREVAASEHTDWDKSMMSRFTTGGNSTRRVRVRVVCQVS
jgi:hypothetical protein